MQQRVVRWGFLGCGRVVMTKSGRAFQNVANSEIYAIMRRDLDQARLSAEHFGCKYYYNDVKDLLADSNVDAVYISTPPGLHYEQALRCCEAGKALYIEKPFARNYAEAAEIIKAFSESGLPLYVAHYRRALPRFNEIKRIIESGEIGDPLEVDFRLTRIYGPESGAPAWMYEPVLSGGGKFFDIAPHTIDTLVYLLGDFIEAYGITKKTTAEHYVEDLVMMTFKTEQGVVGTANFNLVSNKKGDSLVIYGSAGRIEASIHASDTVRVVSESGERTFEMTSPEYIEEPLVATVVEDLLGLGICPSRGIDALPTVRIIDTVLDSYYGGRQRDFWNHPDTWNQGF